SMGAFTDNAFETDAVVLNETIGLYAGSSTPEVDAPDAPEGSVYYRSNGQRYTRTQNTGSGIAEDWVLEDPEGTGGGAAVQLSWRFSTSTVEANPGSKRIRFDNAAPASVTKIFINDTTNNNFDASALLNALQSGDRIYVQESADATAFLLATVDTITDNTGWFTLEVTPITVGVLPTNNKDVGVLLIFGGGAGISTFTGLSDTPANYTGAGGDFVAVNAGETGLEFVTPTDMDSVQARRTTTYTVTGAFADVTHDATDVENAVATVDHDDTNTERLNLKEAGLYMIYYGLSVTATSGVSEAFKEILSRVQANGAGGALPGSADMVEQVFDSSIVGDNTIQQNMVRTFLYEATANDFVALQMAFQNATGTITVGASDIVFGAVRMKGPRGVKGADGAPGAGSTVNIADEGTNIANTPHSRLDFVGAGVTASDGGAGTATITIPGGGAGTTNDAVQARRTTTLSLSAAFQDITLDATDVETDAAVIEHNNTNTDDIDIKVAGTYEISYHAPIDTSGLANGDTWDVTGRIRVNDTGGELAGSTSFVTAWQDGSVDGSDFGFFVANTVIATLSASDKVTLQIDTTDNSGSGGTIGLLAGTTLKVKRLV
ncbi:MAG: hypothetical protein ACXABY_25855, partial [Candidatus Thorarchaeota archaeon]